VVSLRILSCLILSALLHKYAGASDGGSVRALCARASIVDER